MIGRARRALLQLLRAEDRFQGSRAIWNGTRQRELVPRWDRLGQVFAFMKCPPRIRPIHVVENRSEKEETTPSASKQLLYAAGMNDTFVQLGFVVRRGLIANVMVQSNSGREENFKTPGNT